MVFLFVDKQENLPNKPARVLLLKPQSSDIQHVLFHAVYPIFKFRVFQPIESLCSNQEQGVGVDCCEKKKENSSETDLQI
jgi:hypothetical protein